MLTRLRPGFLAIGLVGWSWFGLPPATVATTPTRPNILLVITDDQAWSTFNQDLMPSVYSDLVGKGVMFTRAYDSTSECCPSRAQIMTGLYEEHTGVDGNRVPLKRPTIVNALHDMGYRTLLSGKYLNSWPCTPRPEFTQWVCSYGYNGDVDPTLNVNGVDMSFTGYTTQIEADYVRQFIAGTPSDQPFFVMYTPKSPHLPADDPRYDGMPVDPIRGGSYDQETRTGKLPMYLERGPLAPDEVTRIDNHHRDMAQSVRALDDDIGSILASLGPREQNTLVVFISDNGYLYGNHRRDEKLVPFEESVNVPMIVRYPALLPENQPFVSDALVQNIDIAPTIADLLGMHWGVDGTSLVPLIAQQATQVRTGALMTQCQGASYPCYRTDTGLVPSYRQIVTAQYSYVEYATNERELYDLVADPLELDNVVDDPGHAQIRSQLAAQLAGLSAPPPTDTTIVTGPSGPQQDRAFSFTYFSQSRFALYECRLDGPGGVGTWQPCDKQPFVTPVLADGSYTFNVRGTDEHGVTDPTPDTRSFSLSETGPHVQITSAPPLDGHSGDVSFEFSGDPSIVSYRCRLTKFGGSAAWVPCSSGVSYTALSDNQWSFQVYGQDALGNRTNPPAQWLFRVDNTGPTFILTKTPDRVTRSTTATFAFYPDEETTGEYSCKLDQQARVDCTSGTITFTNLTPAGHTFLVNATDLLGDNGKTQYAWTVDLSAPTVSIDSGPPPVWDKDFAVFKLSSTDPHTFFLCTLDAQPQIVCSNSARFYALADGSHTLQVSAFDEAGNVSGPVTWNWTQQTIRPAS